MTNLALTNQTHAFSNVFLHYIYCLLDGIPLPTAFLALASYLKESRFFFLSLLSSTVLLMLSLCGCLAVAKGKNNSDNKRKISILLAKTWLK